MAKQKEEARVQLNFGGGVIEVKESSVERFTSMGATKYDAKKAKAAEKALADKQAEAEKKRTERAEALPVVVASEETPEVGADNVKDDTITAIVEADESVKDVAVTRDDATPEN